MVTPVSKEQYIGLNTTLNLPADLPVWFGLLANESMTWNRYTEKQTVHSLEPISLAALAKRDNVVFWNTPEQFKCPVFYHYNFFVVDKYRKYAACVCDKGERPMPSR